MISILAESSAAAGAAGGGMFGLILWCVVIFGLFYFMMIRPQKKEQKKKDLMLSEVAVGDTVLTIAGFYGTIIDVVEDTVIVEFGNNRNCRIPMQKSAISEVEKPEAASAAAEESKKESKKDAKK
ncbi:MAG: preprotein translocase subunit YajC [Muribaculaceae bacterium]|nr:preprotein translocase subunit YajC [Roseburia sp.]MCM1431288.1 preprotein translocase subunit YajC [Muribaculaceae bacterium]MCM1492226.1 preprotein translocase subunit YajC [Muribaculaceae bacterium]